MSAIFGIFQRNKKPVSGAELESMNLALSHRGKDGCGTWIDGAVGFGHQMRWITPESLTEKLPYYNSSSKLAITADARIDNRQELFAKLAISKNEHKSIADSELILFSYEKWGERCVDYLVGDFVFTIWDGNNKKVFCATDPMGMRPIYYYVDDKLFAFASEIKALLTLPQIPKQLNEEQFARYLTYELSLQETEQTCFKDIYLLTSGKTLVISERQITINSHGQPDFNKTLQLNSEAEYLEAFREIFDEAVHCRMRSAYPVTCLLSGGLDSSSIASVAAKKLQQENLQLTALSRVLPSDHKGPEKDERYYINQVRDRWKINITDVIPPDTGVYDRLEEECRRAEHPFVDSRHYQYRAFQNAAAEQNARVILDGYGGETSASSHGTGYFAELAWRGRWLLLSKELRARSNIENQSLWTIFRGQVLKPFAPTWLELSHHRWKHGYKMSAVNSTIVPEFAARMKIDEQLGNIRNLFSTHSSIRKNEKDIFELNRSETPRLYNPKDSVALYPYLDIRLLEFCFSIPPWLKINNGWKRYLIRAGMEGMLPSEIQWRTTKQPFSPDHPRRVKAAEDQVSAIIADIRNDDPIRNYIDIHRISRFLQEIKKQPVLSHNDVYSLAGKAGILQRGIYAIVFSKVFSDIF